MSIKNLKSKYLPKIIGSGINGLGLVHSGKAVDIALDLFRSPKKGRVEPYQNKFLNKFARKKLEFEGMTVSTYDDRRPGKSILLCHGWESNSYRWRMLYKLLAGNNYNVILLDAPAHGASGSSKFDGELYAGFINTALEFYSPEIIIGHSVGAYSAIYALYKYDTPSLKKAVILASPDKLTDISERYFNMIGLSERLRIKYIDRLETMFGWPADYFNASDFSKQIDVPAIIIHDKQDTINLYYEAEEINKSWDNSRLISTEGLGHSLQDESVYRLILDYIEE
jgi:pimeloyl-ACP methyl ester carboxylesterase